MINNSLRISIVIPAYNAAKTIERTLQAIGAQVYSSPIEIVVVDDGSSDDTAKIVKSFDRVNYLYQTNAGPAAARNRGAGACQGEIIFFTDSDCSPHPDWIQKILPHFSDPKIVAVCGSYGIANPNELLASCVHAEILFRHRRIPPEPKVFGSYNVAIRRDVFMQMGGFSLKYRHASGEDNDLSYRILQAGYKIRFDPTALVDHVHPSQVNTYLREQFRHGFWRARMYCDHPQMSRGDDYTFWKDALEVGLAYFATIAGGILFFGLLAFLHSSVTEKSFFSVAQTLWFWSAGALFSLLFCMVFLEVFFASCILGLSLRALYFAGVMFLRSFSRSAGFLYGIIQFLPSKMGWK